MSYLRRLAAFAYDFVVGDDPLVAILVLAGLGLTAAVSSQGAAGWWVLPCAVFLALGISLVRGARG